MSDDFDFEEGDTVLVRVRQHGDSGRIQAKFVAEVDGFDSGFDQTSSDLAKFDPPWSMLGMVNLRCYEAEFEVVDDGQDHI